MTKHIDADAISSRPEDRLRFLEEFIGFTDDDWVALRQSTEILVPAIPALLDELYDHLVAFDATRRLVSTGDVVDPLYIAVRKQHLVGWIRATVGAGPDARAEFANYLNVIGRRHTALAGDPARTVPPRYLVGLVGFMQVSIARAIHTALLDEPERALRLSLAWSKMLVIQLEMFLKNVAPHWPEWDESAKATARLG